MTGQLTPEQHEVLTIGHDWIETHSESLFDLLMGLTSRPSVTGKEGRHDDIDTTVGYLTSYLANRVDRTEVITDPLTKKWEYRDLKDKRENIYTVLEGKGNDNGLICTSHTDTVPAGTAVDWPNNDPYELQEGTVSRVGETEIKLNVAGNTYRRRIRDKLARVWNRRDPEELQSLNILIGRGVYDNKASIVCLVGSLLALEAGLKSSGRDLYGDLIHGHLVDEEVYQVGAKRMVGWNNQNGWLDEHYDNYNRFRAVVLEGSYGFVPIIGHRGLVWLELEAKGKAAHASTPDLGQNAVLGMSKALSATDDHSYMNTLTEPFVTDQLLGETTIVPGTTIAGGEIHTVADGTVDHNGLNKIPDWCEATFDIRIQRWEGFPEGIDEIKSELCKRIEQEATVVTNGIEFDANIPKHGFFPPVALTESREAAQDHPLVKTAIEATEATFGYEPPIEVAPGVTDAAFIYHDTHSPTLVEYGPAGALSHEPMEFIERDGVIEGAKTMLEFTVRELGVV